MDTKLRPGTEADAEACGRICYEAFKSIAEPHGFPVDFPSPEAAVTAWRAMVTTAGFYSIVAETEGEIVGSNFLDERAAVVGVGPITVAPRTQNVGVGRTLMEDVLRRAEERGAAGVRLVQAAYHNRSLSLYAKLGFVVREPLACLQGPAPADASAGVYVRAATEEDIARCAELSVRVLGFDRGKELADAVGWDVAKVAEVDGEIAGYTTGVGFMGHAVATTNDALCALIGAASSYPGPGFLLPMRNGEVLRWCLDGGLRLVQMMNYMGLGPYNDPAGVFLPSVLL